MSLYIRAVGRSARYHKVPETLHAQTIAVHSADAIKVPCCKTGNLTKRCASTGQEPNLKTVLQEEIPAKRELLAKVKSQASKTIGHVKVENTLGGMR